MRKAIRQKWAALSNYSGTASDTVTLASSSTGESCSHSRNSASSYDTTITGSSSYGSTSSSSSSGRAASSTGTSDSASTFSAASGVGRRPRGGGRGKKHDSSASSSKAAESSLVSSSDAIAPLTPVTKAKGEEVEGTTVPSHVRSTSAATTTTTSNGVTIDDADALVPLPSSTQQQQRQQRGTVRGGVSAPPAASSSLSSSSDNSGAQLNGRTFGSLDVLPAPVSPYHFSEEELARQPWSADNDTTTYTSEESPGGLVLRAADVLETIHTVPVEVPPPPEEAQRRRREGGLPYPSHLTFRIVSGAAKGGEASEAAAAAAAASGGVDASNKRENEGKNRIGVTGAAEGRVKKTMCDSCCCGHFLRKREKAQRKAEERAAARQKSYHNELRSHHVPLVNFRTTRDAHANLVDSDNILPTVEEAAGYRHYNDDLQGAEAKPKKLEKAMRQRRRPASGLHWKTKYAYGRRAGGGPRGVGESAFAREGDPQRFWIAQLHERSQVHLEAIETE
jgi:hypothetical protein